MNFRKFLGVDELSPVGEQIATAKSRAWLALFTGGASGLISKEVTTDTKSMLVFTAIAVGGLALGAAEAVIADDMAQKASPPTLVDGMPQPRYVNPLVVQGADDRVNLNRKS